MLCRRRQPAQDLSAGFRSRWIGQPESGADQRWVRLRPATPVSTHRGPWGGYSCGLLNDQVAVDVDQFISLENRGVEVVEADIVNSLKRAVNHEASLRTQLFCFGSGPL